MITYKKYKASIRCEENTLIGKVIGIKDLILFEAKSITKLHDEFKKAIDDYEIACKQIGKNPDKTYSGSFNIRISSKLHEELSIIAQHQSISLNKLIGNILEKNK